VLDHAKEAIEYYLSHRQQRLQQVRAAVLAGASTPHEVVERVYADVDRVLWPAAELSVRAQLAYLQR
jgi:4-hydroxy-3-methylbut-2-enyl diphosphate reductase IspH